MTESSEKFFKMEYGDKRIDFGLWSDGVIAGYKPTMTEEQSNNIKNLLVENFDFDCFTESQLTTMLEKIIEAINKKKAAKEKTVDVGFWDKNGNYEENVQEITSEEKAEIDNGKRYAKINNDGRICKILDEDDEYFYMEGAYSDFFTKKIDCREVLVVYKD